MRKSKIIKEYLKEENGSQFVRYSELIEAMHLIQKDTSLETLFYNWEFEDEFYSNFECFEIDVWEGKVICWMHLALDPVEKIAERKIKNGFIYDAFFEVVEETINYINKVKSRRNV